MHPSCASLGAPGKSEGGAARLVTEHPEPALAAAPVRTQEPLAKMSSTHSASAYVEELRAQHEINERFDAVATATTTLETRLKELAAWTAAQMERLDAEEKKCEGAMRDLSAGRRRATEKSQEDQIAASQARIGRERAEVSRRRKGGEAIFVLQYLETMGLDRKLLPGLDQERLRLSDVAPGPGAPPVATMERQRRAKIAVALSALLYHGWQVDEAAAQISRELKDRGIAVSAAQITEYRRDLKTGDYKKAAEETRPQAWSTALAEGAADGPQHQAPRPLLWTGPPAPALLGELARPSKLGQGYFDRLARFTEWHFACRCGEGMLERDAALQAARFALDFPDGVPL